MGAGPSGIRAQLGPVGRPKAPVRPGQFFPSQFKYQAGVRVWRSTETGTVKHTATLDEPGPLEDNKY